MSTRKVTLQMEQGPSLNFFELEELCDDPGRDESGQEVLAVLSPKKSGFSLSVRDGEKTYKIIDGRGRQAWFKSIDSAVERLSDVPHLWPELVLDARAAFTVVRPFVIGKDTKREDLRQFGSERNDMTR